MISKILRAKPEKVVRTPERNHSPDCSENPFLEKATAAEKKIAAESRYAGVTRTNRLASNIKRPEIPDAIYLNEIFRFMNFQEYTGTSAVHKWLHHFLQYI